MRQFFLHCFVSRFVFNEKYVLCYLGNDIVPIKIHEMFILPLVLITPYCQYY